MSYDLVLFKPNPGEEPILAAQRDLEEVPSSPPTPEKQALKRRVANALITHNPQLEIFQFDFESIAKSQKTSVEEARLGLRHIELNGPGDGNGIQITLFDDAASITVPYWHRGDQAAVVFREIWKFLEIIHRETGWLVYDPQIERAFEPPTSYDEALARYVGVVGKISHATPAGDKSARPWWRFW